MYGKNLLFTVMPLLRPHLVMSLVTSCNDKPPTNHGIETSLKAEAKTSKFEKVSEKTHMDTKVNAVPKVRKSFANWYTTFTFSDALKNICVFSLK
jgi:hypothetical protein